jgi:hypothetical protein
MQRLWQDMLLTSADEETGKYRNYRKVIEDSISAQNANMEIIASSEFIGEIIDWINTFKILTDKFKANPKIGEDMGFAIDRRTEK